MEGLRQSFAYGSEINPLCLQTSIIRGCICRGYTFTTFISQCIFEPHQPPFVSKIIVGNQNLLKQHILSNLLLNRPISPISAVSSFIVLWNGYWKISSHECSYGTLVLSSRGTFCTVYYPRTKHKIQKTTATTTSGTSAASTSTPPNTITFLN